MKSGLITGLNSNTTEKRIKIDKSSLFPCVRCGKIYTNAQAAKISCIGGSSFIDAQGSIYFEHQNEDPVDTDLYIKYFREKYRLCWKEIYLKFSAIMFLEPKKCTKCN
jgi:hypothetical protein